MSFPERDIQSKLDEMEAALNQQADSNFSDTPKVLPEIEIKPSTQVQGWIDTSKEFFNRLPKFGKVAVAIGGVWLGFSILGAVLHVVSSVVSIAILGFIVYIAYRLFSNKSESD